MEEVIGRIHIVRKKSNNLLFLIIREHEYTTIQCVISDPTIIKQLDTISLESIVKICGKKVAANVKSCSIKNYEIQVSSIELLSHSDVLPIQITDKIQSDQETRLNNRWLDLRQEVNQNIFRVQSLICKYFREYMDMQQFEEIHTPKLISTASESGADVFEVNYFNRKAYLAQSPQLYKQMMINSDFKRVYEIGPVFRAEKSSTYRHLTEFTGLDLEMVIENSYIEVIELLWNTLLYILDSLNDRSNIHNLSYSQEPIMITYNEALEKINMKILGTKEEKLLGIYMKERFNTDLFVVIEYPKEERPFYTKCIDGVTHSFDIILCGNEILSGAQREENYEVLKEKCIERCIDADIRYYIESFRYGSYSHGGGGFGLERLTMFILGLTNIRSASLFPRDMDRLTP